MLYTDRCVAVTKVCMCCIYQIHFCCPPKKICRLHKESLVLLSLLLFIVKVHSFLDSLGRAPNVFSSLRISSETLQPVCIYLEKVGRREGRKGGGREKGREGKVGRGGRGERRKTVSISTEAGSFYDIKKYISDKIKGTSNR